MDTSSDRKAALKRMLLIREFETRVGELFADNKLPGFVHLYIGEEAVAVGVCSALNDDDQIYSTHRGHGHALAKGLDPAKCLAELYGREEGVCGGKGGSLHLANVEKGMMGANGLVGSNAPIAAGAALTSQIKETNRVVVSFIGDGAYASGQIHESLNLAATWDLPVIYVIENNLYSAFTPLDVQVNVDDLSELAGGYNIPGYTIDGQDVTKVYETIADAAEIARAGDGPTLVEAKTYRYHGHHEGDTSHEGGYRGIDEIEQWRERDPIKLFKNILIDEGELSQSAFDQMRENVVEEIDGAVTTAEAGDLPDTSVAYDDVFADAVPEVESARNRSVSDGGGL